MASEQEMGNKKIKMEIRSDTKAENENEQMKLKKMKKNKNKQRKKQKTRHASMDRASACPVFTLVDFVPQTPYQENSPSIEPSVWS